MIDERGADVVLAENARLRTFAAEQYDQLLAANRKIEALEMKALAMELEMRNLREQAQHWRSEWHAADRRLEIVRDAMIRAELIEPDWDGSEEEETRGDA